MVYYWQFYRLLDQSANMLRYHERLNVLIPLQTLSFLLALHTKIPCEINT